MMRLARKLQFSIAAALEGRCRHRLNASAKGRLMLMRIALLSGILAATATSAAAQPASQDVRIRAVVPKYCTVGGIQRTVDVTVSFRVMASGDVAASAMANSSTSAICNAPAQLTVYSLGGGARSTLAVANAAEVFDYRISVAFGAATSTLDTRNSAHDSRSARGAVSGNTATTEIATIDALRIAIMPGARPASAAPGSTYLDTIRVVLTPR
jgi:hypothetical protein